MTGAGCGMHGTKLEFKATSLLLFLLSGFCDLLEQHTRGGQRFARFLISWHNFLGTLAQSIIYPFACPCDTAASIHCCSDRYFT